MNSKAWLDKKELECAIAGRYQIADGRDFWIDGVVAREIATRIAEASACKASQAEAQQPHENNVCAPWMPIDTAPKDGSMILVYEKGSISSKRWFPEYSDWAHEFPGIAGNSHWMPLPPAPHDVKESS